MAIPWAEIKEEYISTYISQRDIATKYGITAASVNNHATKENWLKLREEYAQKKAEEINKAKPKPKENKVLFPDDEDQTDGDKITNRERFQRYALASLDLPHIDINNPFQVKERIDDYFKCCYTSGIKPQKPGLAKWLGISRRTLDRWLNGESKQSTHQAIIEEANTKLEEDIIDQMETGCINPTSGIFILKNHYGYKDEQEVVVAQKNPLGALQSPEELRKRIEGCIVIEDMEESLEPEKPALPEAENQ